jgi:hypothetical protein
MNAFLYLQKLVSSSKEIEILKTSEHYAGDLSFYYPGFEKSSKIIQNPNVETIEFINGFWNVTFTAAFWNQQLIEFLQNSTTSFSPINPESFWVMQFKNLHKSLLSHYKELYTCPFNATIKETPDLTNPQDLAIIKWIVEWEFRYSMTLKNSYKIENIIRLFFDWWRSYTQKGFVLRIIDPKNQIKTNQRMLIPTAYSKILEDSKHEQSYMAT